MRRLRTLLAVLAMASGLGASPGWTQNDATDEDIERQLQELRITKPKEEETRDLGLLKEAPSVVQSGPIDPQKYVLGPGDVLEIDLWGRLERTMPLVVTPEGTVFLPGSGTLQLAGKTLAWGRERILRMVADTFRGVRADVRLVRLRTFKVFVSGMVSQPGAVLVTSVTRASEAVARVGFDVNASRRNIRVTHTDGTTQRLDLGLSQGVGRTEMDPHLVDGDVIVVPRATEFMEATGALGKGGRFELVEGDSLSTLLALAQGILPVAVRDRVLLVRFPSAAERETLWIDLDRVQSGEQDRAMRDGDQLFVKYRADYHELPRVEIYGEIEEPGAYPIMLGRDRFSDLVRWSGGFRPLANRAAIHLLRETSAEKQARQEEKDPEFDRLVRLSRSDMTESEYARFQTKLAERKNSFRVDWGQIQKGSTEVDPLLQNGDVVRVDQLVQTVRIEGEVKRPGFVDYAAGRELKDYVDLSGGFTDNAARANIRISRGVTGQVIPARSLKSVQPGDFIWVPERRDVDAWAVFRDIVTVTGQIALIIFTLSR